jgi:hypothetical protein
MALMNQTLHFKSVVAMSNAAASAPSVSIPVSDLFVSRDSVDSFMNGIRAAAIAFVPQWSGMSEKVRPSLATLIAICYSSRANANLTLCFLFFHYCAGVIEFFSTGRRRLQD